MLRLSVLLVSSKEVIIKKKASIMAYTSGEQSARALILLYTILVTTVFAGNQYWASVFWVLCHLLIVNTWKSQSIS